MDEDTSNYLVIVWSHRAEHSYAYGPFRTWHTMQTFCDKVDDTKGWEVSRVEVINSPKAFGSGNSRSFNDLRE